ncbi:12717_t:CDS:2 [Entrophospora sp. SA101]|nr:15802_t:CDS:2 [Entrophospora sp. SA101]CAJ0844103.1 12717_t:CDS:2 [Entrophospora sp. SA101]
MDRFKKAELTSTLRPVLAEKETLLAIQDNVGLYDGSDQKNETLTTTPSSNDENSEIACPMCTFLNHSSMIRCEICDAELETFNKANIDNAVELSRIKSSGGPNPDFIKLAFRGGGASVFYDKLKIAISTKEWEKSDDQSTSKSTSALGTVHSGIKQEETLNQAFKDLDGLMAKAAEMVTLAETISNRLNKESQDSEESSADETLNFRTYMLELGIPNPVTKDSAGSIYHKELACQLAEFLENILEKENGMMSLIDIYCIFNRARGVALISPEDLHKACLLFEELSLPLRLRKYGSGILVVHHSDEKTAQRILEYIQTRGPIIAIDLASLEKMSVVLVNEQLRMVEAKGLICRDVTVEGVRFYDNLITKFKLENHQ